MLAVGLLLAAYAVITGIGPLTVNDELECGSVPRPDSTMVGLDAAQCRRTLAELRVHTVTSSALAGLSLLASFLLPRRS